MYWPALVFSSPEALWSEFHFQHKHSQHAFVYEWKFHKALVRSWKQHGLLAASGDASVKVAVLLGPDLPPSGTRCVPILRDVAEDSDAPLTPYSALKFPRKKRAGLRKWDGYSDDLVFQRAMDMAEQYIATKDAGVLAQMQWSELPNGYYHGNDDVGYTSDGWVLENGKWYPASKLISEAELMRRYPTYRPHDLPGKETYTQKYWRIIQIQKAFENKNYAQKAMSASKPNGACHRSIKKRSKGAEETLTRTGEMHLYDSVMAKIDALPRYSQWSDSFLETFVSQARNDWKESNAQNASDIESNLGDASSSATLSLPGNAESPSRSTSAESLPNISASNSAFSSPSAAPARITPDKPQNDTTSSISDNNASPPRKKQKRGRREVTDLVIPGSLPREGIEWEKPVRAMSLSRAYGLESLPQQPARTVVSNDGDQLFYAQGTGIEAVEMHFLPKNVRFPNDSVMNQAAINARTVVARVFGGDELIGQRDRKYSAYKFNTLSLVDMTVSPSTSAPLNRCMSVLYFSQVENTRSLWIEWFANAVEYRGKRLGLSTLLLQSLLDLAILDNGIDHIFLEVGRDKEGEGKWKAARHVYEKAGFNIVGNDDPTLVPEDIVECCKHFDDSNYDVMRFDCDGKRVPRKSTRRGRTRSSSAS